MVKIVLWSGLRRFTDGTLEFDTAAPTLGRAMADLVAQYPGLGPIFDQGVSVAINGDIVPPNPALILPDEAEVHFLQQMRGG